MSRLQGPEHRVVKRPVRQRRTLHEAPHLRSRTSHEALEAHAALAPRSAPHRRTSARSTSHRHISTNVDVSIKVLAPVFALWYNDSSVPLNSFQTSGSSPTDRDSRCRVGILGFGTVGSTVARRLTGPDPIPQLKLTHIADRRARDKRARQSEPLASLTWTDRFDDLLASDVDIVIETVSGGDPAVDYIRAALLAGKSVVTANKKVIAHQGHAAADAGRAAGAPAPFRGGGRRRHADRARAGQWTLRRSRDGLLERSSMPRAMPCCHGWNRMGATSTRRSPPPVRNGYTEIDPSFDLDGSDAAAKLVILCALAFHLRVDPDAIETRTTAHIGLEAFKRAHLRGGTIRQIAHASYDASQSVLTAWVAPIVRRQRLALCADDRTAECGRHHVRACGRHHADRTGGRWRCACRGHSRRCSGNRARPGRDRARASARRTPGNQGTVGTFICGGRVTALIGLQCHLCKSVFAAEAIYVCEKCLGPLEPIYDYAVDQRLDARDDCVPSEESLALSRVPADRRRTADRVSLGLHAARALFAPGRAARC